MEEILKSVDPTMVINVFLVVLIIANSFMDKLVSKQFKKIIARQEQYIKEQERNKNEVLKYCVGRILQDSVQNEDYETSMRCRDILISLSNVNETRKDI